MPGYILTARAEGKSPKTIDWVAASVGYFAAFLHRYQEPTDVRFITHLHLHLRAFIVELQGRPAYQDHPLTRPQDRLLSPHSVNAYVRGVSAFWKWLIDEEVLEVIETEAAKNESTGDPDRPHPDYDIVPGKLVPE